MSAIQSVGIREFRDHLYKYARENQEPIALINNGETIGYYIPARSQSQKKDLESLRQAVTKLSNMLAETGLTEDDIATDFQELRKQSNL
ncbi:MAG: prevent-host-death family protein [Microcystis wesenbergii Mw_MB_S_20031200_S109D]|uniref:Prevent-host-death family protein n=1 Tax=Microcystis wesenbergii Mw_MB_S_20031200_S109D TaxID=2486241 RepID=A0A552M8K7_9CHRO|nr:MAG: prevent-host-death family protein [Microcystis wesenbergii Mw_MB_S_20031200_S109D]